MQLFYSDTWRQNILQKYIGTVASCVDLSV